MKTVTDEWTYDRHTFTRTYTEEEIRWELDDIWDTEEYQNGELAILLREEHLIELLKQFN